MSPANNFPVDLVTEITDNFNKFSPHDIPLDLETASRHLNSLPVDFTEEDLHKVIEAMSLELTGRELNRMVDKGILNCGLNDDGEFIFWPTPLGELLQKELTK